MISSIEQVVLEGRDGGEGPPTDSLCVKDKTGT